MRRAVRFDSCCTTSIEAHARDTLGDVELRPVRADELVRLEVVPAVSHETVRRTLKKTTSSRG